MLQRLGRGVKGCKGIFFDPVLLKLYVRSHVSVPPNAPHVAGRQLCSLGISQGFLGWGALDVSPVATTNGVFKITNVVPRVIHTCFLTN